MEHYQVVNVPAKKRRVLVAITCDLCGGKIPTTAGQDIDEVGVYHKKGIIFGREVQGEAYSTDLCGPCFESVLMPFLQSKGCEFKRKKWQ